MKRWCKRPPREAQATRHGKPHRVQGQIGNPGAARSAFRESETGFGYRSLRQMILSVARRRQNSAYSLSKTNFNFCRPRGGETQTLPPKDYSETPRVATYFDFIAPRVVSVVEYVFGVQTAGSLKFPS